MIKQAQPPEFLSVSEACAIVGIGRTKLYALMSEGRVKARKAGTRTLIESSSLSAWAASLPAATFIRPPMRTRAAYWSGYHDTASEQPQTAREGNLSNTSSLP